MPYSIRRLCLVLLLPVLLGGKSATLSQADRPNFLIILIDDLRYDAIFQPRHVMDYPNINRLIREGVSFDRAYVTTSLCSPSRASILTGQYASTHGITDNWTTWEGHSLGGRMQELGYRTSYVGKWHMGFDARPKPGWDNWVVFPGQGKYYGGDINVNYRWETMKEHVNVELTNHALEFLDGTTRDQPFLLYLSHKGVHSNYTPEARDANRSDYVPVEFPASMYYPADIDPALCYDEEMANERRLGPIVRNYYLTLKGIDRQIGRILDRLQEKGILENTVIFFTSDNGFLFGEHQQVNKRYAFETSAQVPLMVRYPREFGRGQRVTDQIALNIDIAPTVLDLAGATIPAAYEGYSLRHLYQGMATRQEFVYQLDERNKLICWPLHRALITLDYKYILYPNGFEQVYHRATDPDEVNNLVDKPGGSRLADSLAARLVEARRAIGDW